MTLCRFTLLLLACCWAGAAFAQVRLLPNAEPQSAFSGRLRPLRVVLHNAGVRASDVELNGRLFQTTSATAVHLTNFIEKNLSILPDQTVIETMRFDFPEVRSETLFLVQWLDDENRVIGTTEVLVYPKNLLAEFKALTGGKALGIFHFDSEFPPLLNGFGVVTSDLETEGIETFAGHLAIVGSVPAKAEDADRISDSVKALAKKGVAVVWIQPRQNPQDKITPSFYTVTDNRGAVVVVQAEMVADLAENPQSQLNLIQFAQMALHPEPLRLPGEIKRTDLP